MIDVVSTAGLPAAERFDYWRQAVSETFVPLDATRTGSGDFHGELRGAGLGALRLYRVDADGHRVRRTSRLISAEPGEYFKLGLVLEGGTAIRQDGRTAVLGAGDFAVYDTGRPYTLTHDRPGRLLVLIFPRSLLGLPVDDLATVTATRFRGDAGLGGLISSFLTRAADVLDDVDVRDNHRLGTTVLDLVTTGLAGRLDTRPADPDAACRALFAQATGYIDQHLAETSLAPGRIAAALHISTRYLHKLFRAEGTTVSARIRRLRLEACGHDLRDPMLAGRPVSVIGARWGLPDAAHFSRLFRAAYGLSPRDYREWHAELGRGGQGLCAAGQDGPAAGAARWPGGTVGRPGRTDHRR